MKILFAGLKYDYGLIERGESLEIKSFVPALKSVATKFDTFWLEENGFPDNIDNLQNKLIEHANFIRPDIIFFVLMNDEITIETLKTLKKDYITINWFCDDTWRFDNFTRNVAPHLSYSITTDKYCISEYNRIGIHNVILSQWACLDYELNFNPHEVEYKYDITFVGGKNPTREWIIYELKKRGINVICFGAGWENGRVGYAEMKNIFKYSKINLNLSNSVPLDLNYIRYTIVGLMKAIVTFKKFNPRIYIKNVLSYFKNIYFYFFATKKFEQMKARNFEIPGFGGFQLSQYTIGLEDYYLIGLEVAIFSNIEELVKQCKYYTENDNYRNLITTNGYNRTKEHNYQNRIDFVLKNISKYN